MTETLANKKALIFGVANKKSIAYAIAEECIHNGAEVIITYQNERLQRRVTSLAESIGATALLCDILKDEDINTVFDYVASKWNTLDVLVHSIAYAPTKDLENPLYQTSREGFVMAFESSVYSLISLADKASHLMKENGGSIITLTFAGANKVMPSYKIMGPAKAALESTMRYLAYELGHFNIRVNAISAGPIKTLSSSVMPQFNNMLDLIVDKSPLRSNVSAGDVAASVVYLASCASAKVTGNTIYVDSGINIMGI